MSEPSSSNLKIDAINKGPVAFVRLYGIIDETFDGSQLAEAAHGSDVILNLKGVTRITSFGVREWVNAIAALNEQASRVALVEVTDVLVGQLNSIANFAGGSSVVSVQAPFYCESCGWDTTVSIKVANWQEEASQSIACRSCGAAMEFDDDVEVFFAFAQDAKSVSPELARFIEDFAAAGEDPPLEGSPSLTPRSEDIVRTEAPTSASPLPDDLALEDQPTESRDTGSRGILYGLLAILAAAGIAITAYTFLQEPNELDPTEEAAFVGHLASGRFPEARNQLRAAAAELPPERVADYEKRIEEAIDRELVRLEGEAEQQLERNEPDKALEILTDAAELAGKRDSLARLGFRAGKMMIAKLDSLENLESVERKLDGIATTFAVSFDELRTLVTKRKTELVKSALVDAMSAHKNRGHEEAVALFEAASDSVELNAEQRFAWAESLRITDDALRAEATYAAALEAGLEQEAEIKALYWQGKLLASLGRNDEAKTVWGQLVNNHKRSTLGRKAKRELRALSK